MLTVGFGHTGADVFLGMRISEEEAKKLLWQDTEGAQGYINSCVKVKLNQNEFDALVSFVFNIGNSAFYESTLLKLLKCRS